jgi:nicotinamide mononucleotide (NMN) deamidase PncC
LLHCFKCIADARTIAALGLISQRICSMLAASHVRQAQKKRGMAETGHAPEL